MYILLEHVQIKAVEPELEFQSILFYSSQVPSLLNNFGGNKPCLRFDDVTMFTQP